MEKLAEMIAILARNGLDSNNPPIGFAGGPDLPFLKGKEMRCRKVTLLAGLEDDKIIEFDKHLPYGFLHIDGPDLKPNTIAAIINKIDFKNAWEIDRNGWFDNEDYGVFVEYKEGGGLMRFMPKMFPLYKFEIFGNDPRDGAETYLQLYGLERVEE